MTRNNFAYLPLFIPSISIVRFWCRSARHLGLVVLHVLLRQRRTHFLVCLEMRLLAVFAAVRCCVALVAWLQGGVFLAALGASLWCVV